MILKWNLLTWTPPNQKSQLRLPSSIFEFTTPQLWYNTYLCKFCISSLRELNEFKNKFGSIVTLFVWKFGDSFHINMTLSKFCHDFFAQNDSYFMILTPTQTVTQIFLISIITSCDNTKRINIDSYDMGTFTDIF